MLNFFTVWLTWNLVVDLTLGTWLTPTGQLTVQTGSGWVQAIFFINISACIHLLRLGRRLIKRGSTLKSTCPYLRSSLPSTSTSHGWLRFPCSRAQGVSLVRTTRHQSWQTIRSNPSTTWGWWRQHMQTIRKTPELRHHRVHRQVESGNNRSNYSRP